MSRDVEIVRLRHEDKLTYQAIGDRYGISRERVRQILRDMEADGRLNSYPTQTQVKRIFRAVVTMARLEISQEKREHGTLNRYRSGCKCVLCRAANASQHRRWYRRQQGKEGKDVRSYAKQVSGSNSQ